MSAKVLIAGVDQTGQLAADPFPVAQFTRLVNDRSTATINFMPGYLPDRFAEVLFYARDGVTVAYGGIVLKRSVKAVAPGAIACGQAFLSDWWAYLGWAPPTSRAYAAPVTLGQVLVDLIADCDLASYDISLDPGQVAGPTLQPFAWSTTRASDAIRSLTTTTGGTFVGLITPGKVLSMVALGSLAAPFAITEAAPHCEDFDWDDPDTEAATHITLICGAAGTPTYVQTWVQAGGATSWQADVPEAAGAGAPGVVTVAGLFETLTIDPDPTEASYMWDRTTSPPTLRLGLASAPPDGTILTLNYTAQFPFTVEADAGVTPAINETDSDTSITTLAEGQAEAAGRLAQGHESPRTARIVSQEDGWLPAQQVSVTLPTSRAFTGECSIASVQVDVLTLNDVWEYTLQATETIDAFQGTELDLWRQIVGGGGSGGGAIAISGGGVPPSVVLAAPVYLGGSRKFALAPNPAAWTPAEDFVPFVAPASFSGRLRASLAARLAGIGVRARLFDVTAAAAAGSTTSLVTSTAFVDVSIVNSIIAGHTYRLELQSDTNGGEVYGLGSLEAA